MSQADFAPRLEIDPGLDPCPVWPALVWAEGLAELEAQASRAGLEAYLEEVLARARAVGEGFWPAEVRERVRAMLRHGKYKPSGRSKPASEFLLRAALAGGFPRVGGPVDVNNAISLASGLPGSIFDAELTGPTLRLRRGRPGERYVFNPAGQVIELEDLLLVCRRVGEAWEPCGNPVKDSMATKLSARTRRVVAVLFAPVDEPRESLDGWARRYAELLQGACGAARCGHRLGGAQASD
jgi:DNA/RNA-binding domain of Phe-tRNA-synthetase-like protein